MAKLAYYPLEAEIAGNHADDLAANVQLSIFFTTLAGILACTYPLAKRIRPSITSYDLCATHWFVLCGFIHVFFEGFYAYNVKTIIHSNHFLAQLWREYGYADSRYLTKDATVFCIEATTAALWGPLSFLQAFFILKNHPFRHPLQMIISMGQLYGVVIYIGTGIFDELIYDSVVWRPEPFYFWFYYICMNAFWAFIPAILIYQSSAASAKAIRAMERMANTASANGEIKKNR